jgi:hypothetical protein
MYVHIARTPNNLWPWKPIKKGTMNAFFFPSLVEMFSEWFGSDFYGHHRVMRIGINGASLKHQ